jgi:hypothetical protein
MLVRVHQSIAWEAAHIVQHSTALSHPVLSTAVLQAVDLNIG